jgi:hypothetical protein
MPDMSWTKPDARLSSSVDLHTDLPHPARVYDYLLGGKDNFEADRRAAAAGLKANPNSRIPPRENRAFLRRAVRYLAAEAGIRQFLDIGTGLPTSPNVHEVAQEIAPESRILYSDNDPIVLAHARALLTSTSEGKTAYIDADLTNPGNILSSPILRDTFDLNRPVALLLIAIMHFVPDQGEPFEIVRSLLDTLPSGSYLALSHLTGDLDPEVWPGVAAALAEGGVTLQVRSAAEIRRFFDGLDLIAPGVELATRWRPDPGADPASQPPDAAVSLYVGLARKP